MIQFEEPNISNRNSTEQNIMQIKSYLSALSENLNYILVRIENMEKAIEALESEDK